MVPSLLCAESVVNSGTRRRAVELDRAAVLLSYGLVAKRQAQLGALAGRLGRHRRLEQLVAGHCDIIEQTIRRRSDPLSLSDNQWRLIHATMRFAAEHGLVFLS